MTTTMLASFKPVESALGGLLIGTASGVYMLLARRIAGNSGLFKALILGPRDARVLFIVGLVIAGIVMQQANPTLFEEAPADSGSNAKFAWGVVIGIGTYLANGCTSGHGLCGISRLSVRSFVAVPTFMTAAIVASSIDTSIRTGGFYFGELAPVQVINDRRMIIVCISAVLGLALLLVPTVLDHNRTSKVEKQSLLVSLWCGLCAGTGLSIGGMVRPSVVQAALSPQRFDFTLWVLFMVALATTFVFYRYASRRAGITEACAAPYKRGDIDNQLIFGSVLFGIGWGATGFCPGPLIVAVAARPASTYALLTLAGIIVGVLIADAAEVKVLAAQLCKCHIPAARSSQPVSPPPSPSDEHTADLEAGKKLELEHPDLISALRSGAVVIDLRRAAAAEANDGVFRTISGALSIVWQDEQMHPGALEPIAKSTPLVVFCRSGNRAEKAATFLRDRGYERVINAGGPYETASTRWQALVSERGEVQHELPGLQQLISTEGSSTYTYILADQQSKEAIIIDPVVEHVERDLKRVEELGCTLTLALNTHVHADHVTGTGQLKKAVKGLRSCISKAAGAISDLVLEPEQVITWADGRRTLKVLATPGHTNGCVSFYDAGSGIVFTGDAMLIGGCGRTDFQQGDAGVLYDSNHTQLFTLPPSTLVLPAHDYKGRSFSTINAERTTNPRLTKTKEEFLSIMANLTLPYPKKIDISVPANMVCGVY